MVDKVLNTSSLHMVSKLHITRDKQLEVSKPSVIIEHQDKQAGIEENKKVVEQVLDGLNHFLEASNTHFKFRFHDDLQEYYVTIVDNQTQEVIKEIPPKKMLDMYAAMLGVIIDKRI